MDSALNALQHSAASVALKQETHLLGRWLDWKTGALVSADIFLAFALCFALRLAQVDVYPGPRPLSALPPVGANGH